MSLPFPASTSPSTLPLLWAAPLAYERSRTHAWTCRWGAAQSRHCPGTAGGAQPKAGTAPAICPCEASTQTLRSAPKQTHREVQPQTLKTSIWFGIKYSSFRRGHSLNIKRAHTAPKALATHQKGPYSTKSGYAPKRPTQHQSKPSTLEPTHCAPWQAFNSTPNKLMQHRKGAGAPLWAPCPSAPSPAQPRIHARTVVHVHECLFTYACSQNSAPEDGALLFKRDNGGAPQWLACGLPLLAGSSTLAAAPAPVQGQKGKQSKLWRRGSSMLPA